MGFAPALAIAADAPAKVEQAATARIIFLTDGFINYLKFIFRQQKKEAGTLHHHRHAMHFFRLDRRVLISTG
ncbi:hypothetical protein CIX30_08350 [Salmonella enterica]|nr:hypothetical protein [Salmonella enterica]EBN6860816.1 hypothetical protein [Salmonella enterica]ECS7524586.1 hypothetical protein [Salmonella enterica]